MFTDLTARTGLAVVLVVAAGFGVTACRWSRGAKDDASAQSGHGGDTGTSRQAAANRPRMAADSAAAIPACVSATLDGLRARRPDILVVLVDALRRDVVGAWGGAKGATPAIDSLAERSIVFDRAVAQAPWTRPSVASIFTGLPPHLHGVNGRDSVLPEEALTISEILHSSGYETSAIITNGTVSDEFGFNQGFDSFRKMGGPRVDGTAAVQTALEILTPPSSGHPRFVYLHLNDAHAPYTPADRYRERFADGADLRAGKIGVLRPFRQSTSPPSWLLKDTPRLYLAEVAFVDSLIGTLVSRLEATHRLDDLVMILVSDHGEEFWEDGLWGHGLSLHDILLDIPMLVKLPGPTCSGRTSRLAQHVDLLATVVDLAGASPPSFTTGVNLLSAVSEERVAFSMVAKNGCAGFAVTSEGCRLVMATSEFFENLHGREQMTCSDGRKLTPRDDQLIQKLRDLAAHELTRTPILEEQSTIASNELQDELKALGYQQ